MSDRIDLSALNGQIPPYRIFKVVTDKKSAHGEQTIAAHMMSVTDDGGVLVFYQWRMETLGEQPVIVQYCTDAFKSWDEAHEVQMPAVKAGKAH